MRKLKALWYAAVWTKEWLLFTVRYLRVWEPTATHHLLSSEEADAIHERMSTGPLRYEYARVESLKERAIAAWDGDVTAEARRREK